MIALQIFSFTHLVTLSTPIVLFTFGFWGQSIFTELKCNSAFNAVTHVIHDEWKFCSLRKFNATTCVASKNQCAAVKTTPARTRTSIVNETYIIHRAQMNALQMYYKILHFMTETWAIGKLNFITGNWLCMLHTLTLYF